MGGVRPQPVRDYRPPARAPSQLEIESCSGGGGRIDLGILQRVEEVWTSDNTEAFEPPAHSGGFSQAYAPKIMSAWVTDVPNMNGPQHSAGVPFPGGHAGRARDRCQPEPLYRTGFDHGLPNDRGIQTRPGHGPDRQPGIAFCRREPTMLQPTNMWHRRQAGRCCSPSGTRRSTKRRRP